MSNWSRPDPSKRARFISWNEYVAAHPEFIDLFEDSADGRDLRFMADYHPEQEPS